VKITIVGGGFGGVKAAQELAKDRKNQITLISKESNLQYYPALYRTATGYSHTESWISLAKLFARHKNVRIVRDEIVKISPTTMSVKGASGASYTYGKLILALGSITSFFGIEGIETYSYGIKSEEEIRKLQRHLFRQMREGNDDEKHYVVIGAGPTGVELAGALGEYIRALRKKFGIKKRRLNINLVEAAPRVLPRSHESISKKAHKRLKKLGIYVRTSCRVERQTANSLMINGKALESQTVIWTSGVANSPFFGANAKHFTLNERGKVVVNEFMLARPHVYVIGDNAATPMSGLAQTALHDAVYVARHLKGSKKPYTPPSISSVVPIGRHWATFEHKNIRFTGWPANILRECADIIGYSDIMPIPAALQRWASGKRRKLNLPDDVSLEEQLS
jgi:NADH dehydrogenase